MNKYPVKYFFCSNCGYIHTAPPYWLEESYENPINDTDTGMLKRNINLANRIAPSLWMEFGKNGKFLDWAGGYGVFVRLMRDFGFDFRWSDPYTKNIFAMNFEASDSDKFDLVTCCEVFEHLENPMHEFEKLLEKTDNILISTELFDADNIPSIDQWYYYDIRHGQHISFFSTRTLNYIAKRYGLHLISNKHNLHLFSRNKLRNKNIISISMKTHRLLLLPFTEYVRLKMQTRIVEDSKLAGN